jgi:hypothetical protein
MGSCWPRCSVTHPVNHQGESVPSVKSRAISFQQKCVSVFWFQAQTPHARPSQSYKQPVRRLTRVSEPP